MSVVSRGGVEHIWLSISISICLSLPLSHADRSVKVSHISSIGLIPEGLVGSRMISSIMSRVAIVAGTSGVAVAGWEEPLVRIGVVEPRWVGHRLSSSQDSTTDHKSNLDHGSSTFQQRIPC